jgi:transcriptional regulator with XRE-family HTH domain
MKKKTRAHHVGFGSLLVEKRRERGYPTAYSFFHGRGARRFGVTFQQYLRVEKGTRLPSLKTLEAILDALGTRDNFEAGRTQLLRAFLKASVEGSPLFDPILEPKATVVQNASAEAPEAMLKVALKRALESIPSMTVEQAEAIVANRPQLWIFEWLLHTGDRAKPEELGARFGLRDTEVQAALARLVELKLVKKERDGTHHCPYFETDLSQPHGTLLRKRSLFVTREISSALEDTGKKCVYSYQFMTVESEDRIPELAQVMREAMHKTYLFRERRRVPDGRFVSVEFRVATHGKT